MRIKRSPLESRLFKIYYRSSFGHDSVGGKHIFDFSLLGIGTEFTRRDHRPRTNLKKCLRVELVTVYSTTTGSGSTQACQPSRNKICTVVLVLYHFTV
jgi:hypothetical protein